MPKNRIHDVSLSLSAVSRQRFLPTQSAINGMNNSEEHKDPSDSCYGRRSDLNKMPRLAASLLDVLSWFTIFELFLAMIQSILGDSTI